MAYKANIYLSLNPCSNGILKYNHFSAYGGKVFQS